MFAPTFHTTYSVELHDLGPEPDWHKDRTYYSPWWGRYEFRCLNAAGELLAKARGQTYRDAWRRLSDALAAEMHWR
jgi:hypothetical protein